MSAPIEPTEPVVPPTPPVVPPPAPPVPTPQSDDDRTLDKQPMWVQKLVGDLRQESAANRKKAEDAEKAKLAEEGRYKELYEAEARKNAEIAAENARQEAERQRKDLARQIAKKTLDGLVENTDTFAAFLTGGTEAELLKEAETLKAALPKPTPPRVEGGRRAGGPAGTDAQAEAELRDALAKSGEYGTF